MRGNAICLYIFKPFVYLGFAKGMNDWKRFVLEESLKGKKATEWNFLCEKLFGSERRGGKYGRMDLGEFLKLEFFIYFLKKMPYDMVKKSPEKIYVTIENFGGFGSVIVEGYDQSFRRVWYVRVSGSDIEKEKKGLILEDWKEIKRLIRNRLW